MSLRGAYWEGGKRHESVRYWPRHIRTVEFVEDAYDVWVCSEVMCRHAGRVWRDDYAPDKTHIWQGERVGWFRDLPAATEAVAWRLVQRFYPLQRW